MSNSFINNRLQSGEEKEASEKKDGEKISTREASTPMYSCAIQIKSKAIHITPTAEAFTYAFNEYQTKLDAAIASVAPLFQVGGERI